MVPYHDTTLHKIVEEKMDFLTKLLANLATAVNSEV
jgi:hypothetical protein